MATRKTAANRPVKKRASHKRPTPRRAGTSTSSPRGLSPVEPDLDRAVDLVTRLLVIPGRSGQEADVAEFIHSELRRAGVRTADIRTDTAHRRTLLAGNTGNLICKLPGSQRTPRRLLMAHMDTVPVCVGAQLVRQGDWIRSGHPERGIGADDRAGVAVVLHTALEIVRRKLPHPPLTFCWTVQEEIGLHGARCLNHRLLGHPRLAFNWDGGAPDKLTIGATSGHRLGIQVRGIASHAGGAPEMGVSAVSITAIAIADLVANGWHGAVQQGKKRGTSNVGYVHGGESTNVVTDYVELRAEARSHDTAFRKRIVREIEQAFRRAADRVTNAMGDRGCVEFNGHLDYEAFRLPSDDPSLLTAEKAILATGRSPVRAITNGGVDANWMTHRGIATVTLGCGQVNQHMVTEALDLSSFRDACRIAFYLATGREEHDGSGR